MNFSFRIMEMIFYPEGLDKCDDSDDEVYQRAI